MSTEAQRARSRAYYYRNREAVLARQRASYDRAGRARQRAYRVRNHPQLRQYGITIADYDRMLAAQGGVCALCHRPPTPKRRLAVDHEHDTGLVRGLLCTACNMRLGMLIDNPGWLARAVRYARLLGPPKRLAGRLSP